MFFRVFQGKLYTPGPYHNPVGTDYGPPIPKDGDYILNQNFSILLPVPNCTQERAILDQLYPETVSDGDTLEPNAIRNSNAWSAGNSSTLSAARRKHHWMDARIAVAWT